jgi:hypothetical protein
VSQENLKWDVSRGTSPQDPGVYPDSFDWKVCPANLKVNLPSPASSDFTGLNAFRKLVFNAAGAFQCNTSGATAKGLALEQELDEDLDLDFDDDFLEN